MARFRLEAVLSYKAQMVENLTRELAKLEERQRAKRQEILFLKREIHKIMKKLGQSQNSPQEITEIVTTLHYLSALEKKLKAKHEELEIIQHKCQTTRNKLIEMAKDKKILEKLKEKWWQHEQMVMREREQRLLDEVAINGFLREEI